MSAGPGRCTSSRVAPVLDTIFTGLQGARIVYAATASDSAYGENQPLSRSADIALGVAFSALFLSSAVYGYVTTAHCSELKKGPPVVLRSRDKDEESASPPSKPAYP